MQNSIESLYEIWEKSGFSISTDTRNVTKGSVFFCLIGEKYDANFFAEQALQNGAICVVTCRDDLKNKQGYFFVADTLLALQELSKMHSQKMPAKKIMIGGSNGKTTTKELITQALQTFGETHFTQANFNNHIGVPLTLLGIKPNHQYAVIELGTNHPGEMKVLCDLISADIGIITNIGKEHLEGFGDIESVAKEESEVYQAIIRSNGIAIVNLDDEWLQSMSKRLNRSLGITVNPIQNNDYFAAKVITEMPHLCLSITESTHSISHSLGDNIAFEIAGSYNAYNILFAIATVKALNLDLHRAIDSLTQYRPTNNRSEWRKLGDTQIFLDAYNANPSSMEVAIKSFSTLAGKKVVFLGDMLELGEYSESEHKALLELIEQLGLTENTFIVGSNFYHYCKDFPMRFENVDSLLAWLDTHPIVNTEFAFIKGSRGIKMERVLEHFQKS